MPGMEEDSMAGNLWYLLAKSRRNSFCLSRLDQKYIDFLDQKKQLSLYAKLYIHLVLRIYWS